MTRDDIVKAARTWLGTPFRHQGRLKGQAGDCAGLLIGAAHEVGYAPEFDITGYGREPVPEKMRELLDQYFDPIRMDEIGPIDVLWMLLGGSKPSHVGIVASAADGALTVIHLSERIAGGRCVEHRLNDMWRARIVRAYRFRGLEVEK